MFLSFFACNYYVCHKVIMFTNFTVLSTKCEHVHDKAIIVTYNHECESPLDDYLICCT